MTSLFARKFQAPLCFWRLLFDFHFPGFKSEPAWSDSEAPKGFKGISPDQQSAARWTKRQIIKPMKGSARSNSRQRVKGGSNQRGYLPVEEPTGGWAATTPNSECGRHLIDLYCAGHFTVHDSPSYIQNECTFLQEQIDPKKFRFFVRDAKSHYLLTLLMPSNEETWKDQISSSASSDSDSNMASDEEQEEGPPGPPATNRGTVTTNCGNMAFTRRAPDAPMTTTPIKLRSLVHPSAYTSRDQQIHLDVWIVEGAISFLILMDHTAGLNTLGIPNLIAQRVPKRKKLVTFKFATNKNMKNEESVMDMFNRMGIAGTDAWVVSSKQNVADRLGGGANANQGSLTADSKNIIVLELPSPVVAEPSPWTVTMQDGTTKQMQPIFAAEDLIWIHWPKEEASENAVVRAENYNS